MQMLQKDEATAALRRIPFMARNEVNPRLGILGLSFAAADLQVSKNGAAEGNSAGANTEVGGGYYYYEATALELDTLGVFSLRTAKTGVLVEATYAQVLAWPSRLALSAGPAGIIVGAAETGTLSTTQMTTNLTEATDSHYVGRSVVWTSGVLLGQASDITAYLGSTGMLTYTTTTEAPSNTDTFIII